MKLTAVDGDTPFLPEEIIRNILTRLPVKSLIRFQCVCKHWKKLIKTDSVITERLHHSTNENPLLLLQSDFRCDPLHLYMLNYEMQVLEIQSSPMVDSLRYARIVGCSNGLLCVSTGYGAPLPFLPSLFLWNPATREIRQVPRIMHDDIDSNYDLFAFGFSPIVNDYKIVVSHETAFDSEDDLVVEVYSLNTGSWRSLVGCLFIFFQSMFVELFFGMGIGSLSLVVWVKMMLLNG
ncbi:putative F-box protein At3g16210 [Prosopis cineraria]|uniref:putative F-box protein At3g16210 n=1 Tax=Prosopis cineraria TaxID=364024 RepID=UPI00240F58A2|nr:putative F-box protein At3g16210 [Prosopis cineraria]